jgi:hypothetical protein
MSGGYFNIHYKLTTMEPYRVQSAVLRTRERTLKRAAAVETRGSGTNEEHVLKADLKT